jgi:hypothetical protein
MKREAFYDRSIRSWIVRDMKNESPSEFFANKQALLAVFPLALKGKKNSIGGYYFEVQE